MLVLTRALRESLVIGTDIKITVLEIRGNQVRLGIDAPRSTPVHREEIYEIIQLAKEDIEDEAAIKTTN